MKNNSFKHTITITFVTNEEVNPRALDRVMWDAEVQVEALADDYGIEYSNKEVSRESKLVGVCKVCLEIGCKGCSLP